MLRAEGVAIETGCPVGRIVPSMGSKVEVEPRGGRAATFDGVVVTVPGPVAADLCPALSDGEQYRLRRPRYLGVLCASVLLGRPLGGFYVTNLLDPDLPFTGIIEMSALVDRSEFGGRHLVYLPRYVASDDTWLRAAEDRVRRVFLGGLKRVYPDLRDEDVTAFRLSRARYVMPVPALFASKGSLPIRTSVPGLFVANSALVVAGTQNVNETVGLADRVASEVG
jgi:protoporphyrinogen oxidase